MPTTPYELTTLSGADLAVVRRSFAHVTGTLTFPNLATVAAADIPNEVKEITVLGARRPGDAGPSMTMERADGPIATHAGWVRSVDRYKRSPGIIRNSDFIDNDPKDFYLVNGYISDGVMHIGTLEQPNVLTVGVQYNFSFDYQSSSPDPCRFGVGTENDATLVLGEVLRDGVVHAFSGSFLANGTSFKIRGWDSNYSGIIDNLTVLPASGEASSETSGGYWEYVSKNQPIYIEWFGGANDFFITNQVNGTAGINQYPTNNKVPFEKAASFIYVAKSGNCNVGPTIQLGYGGYYVDDKPSFNRALTIQGMGSGYQNSSTRIVVAPGKTGLFFTKFSGGVGSQGTVRDLEVVSLGFGGSSTAHGIDVKCTSIIENCSVTGFGGNGINVDTDVNIGDGANCSRVKGCYIGSNKKNGIYFKGGDSNACHTDSCSFIGNGEWAIKDESFLANAHHGHHASTNGDLRYMIGGPFYAIGGNGPTTVIGCYSEGDQPPSYAGSLVTFIGGLQGAGLITDGGVHHLGRYWNGGMSVQPSSTIVGDNCYLNLRHGGANVLWEFGSGQGASQSLPLDFRYFPDLGFFQQYGNLGAYFSYGITPAEGSTIRTPRARPNEFMLCHGAFIGAGVDTLRYLTWGRFGGGPPNETNFEYRVGDLCIDDTAGALGWICSAGGITTSTTWTTGTEYEVGTVLLTSAGRTYELKRKPYNPDAWTKPGSTVKPTHTTLGQEVNYPEPNPHIDAGEGSTIPGYTWQVHPDQPQLDWIWASGTIYFFNSYVFVRGPNLYYFCRAEPTQPTPIFNQVWAMPKSTIQPTHTSGDVEYPEPNPSPSGSEPATIPGYVWTYISSNPAPVWSRVGARFYRGSVVHDAASLAAGAVSGDITMTVTGAVMGDFPTISCSIDTPGLAFVNQRVSATDTVKFRLWNVTGSSIDLASATFYASIER